MSASFAADDPRFTVTGAAAVEVVDDQAGRRLRLRRPISSPATGYGWDNPGAAIAFRANGRFTARLRYSERHLSRTARNGTGLILVDGRFSPTATFAPVAKMVLRAVEVVEVALPEAGTGWHDYALVMPYGDSVEFLGLAGEGEIAAVEARPRLRWVAYGDSVTQGFDASHSGATYPWLVAAARGWEAINLGIGGRSTTPEDAAAIAGLRPDLVSIAIGVNDWQDGVRPSVYGERLLATIRGVRSGAPRCRIAVITPLWVTRTWCPAKEIAPLADYRSAATSAAAAAGVPVIPGPELIDADPHLFNKVAVHPNDTGFARLAANLAARLHQ